MGKDTVMVHERLAIVGVGESLVSRTLSHEDLEDMEGVTQKPSSGHYALESSESVPSLLLIHRHWCSASCQ
jgi:hypothetical protein